jgi:hypothetical protein
VGRLLRNAAECGRCQDLIVSEHRHDFRSCKCGAIFVDGGLEYQRYGFREPGDFTDLSERAPDEPPE